MKESPGAWDPAYNLPQVHHLTCTRCSLWSWNSYGPKHLLVPRWRRRRSSVYVSDAHTCRSAADIINMRQQQQDQTNCTRYFTTHRLLTVTAEQDVFSTSEITACLVLYFRPLLHRILFLYDSNHNNPNESEWLFYHERISLLWISFTFYKRSVNQKLRFFFCHLHFVKKKKREGEHCKNGSETDDLHFTNQCLC